MFKKSKDKCKNKNGFTMVELIVVIVIILILSAALVPSLIKYVDNAKKANCKADAAVILSQLQADYTSTQAGVPMITVFEGIDISQDTQVDCDATDSKNAVYQVADNKITLFSYYDGEKYTATWTEAGKWQMTTDGTPTDPTTETP